MLKVDENTLQRAWITPSFERQELKEALNSLTIGNFDGAAGYS